MYCKGSFQVDGLDYTIMKCKISIPGPKIDAIGTVLAPAPAPKFTVVVESTEETHLLRWINEMRIKSHVKLQFLMLNDEGIGRTFDLYDVRCVSNHEHFTSRGEVPMSNTLTLVPAILVADGVLLRVQNWKIQNPDVIMGKISPTVIGQAGKEAEETVKDPVITQAYWIDTEGNKLAEPIEGNNKLVVHTENGVGHPFDIDLGNPTYRFAHLGNALANNMLKNYVMNSAEEEIPLEASLVEQSN